MQITAVNAVWWLLGTLGTTFLGSYLSEYFKKKGETKAIQEDLKRVVQQTSEITKATEDIKAKISGDFWDRQKRWEMKREVLFSAAKALAEVDNASLSFWSAFSYEQEPGDESVNQLRAQSSSRWLEACAKFDETRLLVAIVCARETKAAFDSVRRLTLSISTNIIRSEWEIYNASQEDMALKLLEAREAMRKELEIDDAV